MGEQPTIAGCLSMTLLRRFRPFVGAPATGNADP
jgi:hypothetical protein